MLVLGINPAENSAAAFVLDGRLVFAAEEERFTGRKHIQSVPYRAIEAGLAHLGARLRDVDRVALGWNPTLGVRRRALASLALLDGGSAGGILRRGAGYTTLAADTFFIRRRLQAAWPGEPLHLRVRRWPHHQAHAAAAYHWSGEPEAAILTMDGVGEEETTVLWRVVAGRFTALERFRFPHSLGHFYSVMTAFLGFSVNDGEGKTMGLSSYGSPRHADLLKRWTTGRDGALRLDIRRINYPGARAGNFHRDLTGALGPPIERATAGDERHCDVAASAQAALEQHVQILVRRLAERTGAPALCLGGGVALNCACNGRLLDLGCFERIHVGPAPTDAGTAVGAAWLESMQAGCTPALPDPVFLGPRDDDRLPEQVPGLVAAEVEDAPAAVASLLARGLVVGVFRDRMEFGPRALGNRSILAAAGSPAMKDRINAGIKFREPFRPFAPAVLAEEAADCFEFRGPSPFMSFAFRARGKGRERLPAVVHVDGTGRLQTVDRERFPFFHELLCRYRELAGDGAVLNTSLNVRGRPIAATKREALRLLRETALDALLADRQLFVKEGSLRSPPSR